MTQEEAKREEVIENISNLLRTNPFTFEIKVVKKPKGIKMIYEITQEEMDAMLKRKGIRYEM